MPVLAFALLLGSVALPLPELSCEVDTLGNGLVVILHPDRSQPTATVSVWYHVGSRDEQPGLTGLAHVCEHMMFQGSAHHPEDYSLALQEVGGVADASTDRDRTMYWETVPSAQLERALWLEADRMATLPAALDPGELATQLEVIANEVRQRGAAPYARGPERLQEMLYGPDHPYGRTVAGEAAEVARLTVPDVEAFLKAHYRPDNASLCVAGDFDQEQARAWIRRYFGPIAPGCPRDRDTRWRPAAAAERRAVLYDEVPAARLYLGWHTPAWFAPGDAELDLLADILGARGDSRLRRLLVDELEVAQDVGVRQESRELGGVFTITVTMVPGRDAAAAEAAILDELARVAAEGVAPAELERARTRRHADFLRLLERTGGRGGRAELLNRYQLYAGDPRYLPRDLERYLRATPRDLGAWAARCLTEAGRAVLGVLPVPRLEADPGRGPEGDLPRGGPAAPFAPPEIQRETLPNGLSLYLVRRPGLPLVEMHVTILGGTVCDPVGRAGAGALTAALLDEGTAGRDARTLAADADRLGAGLRTGVSPDGVTVSLNVLAADLAAGLDLLQDVVRRPALDEEEFRRQRDRFLARLDREEAAADRRGAEELQALVFGRDHPYGRAAVGTRSGLAALTVQDVREFHARWYGPRNTALVMVGDLTLAQARSAAQKAFGGWRIGSATPVPRAAVAELPEPRIVVIDRPSAAQAFLAGGAPGPARSHPDYPALQLLDTIVGGKSTSRLNLNLRQEKGLTYGVHSLLRGYRDGGMFAIQVSAAPDQAGLVLTELTAELQGLRGDRPLTAAELELGKAQLTAGFLRGFETGQDVAAQVDRLLYGGAGTEDWAAFPGRIEALEAGDLQRVAGAYLDPDKMVWVVVGPWRTLRESLAAAGFEDITVREEAALPR